MTSEPPGWFRDPEPGSTLLRWWDGEAWTAWQTDEDDPPPPPDIPVATVAPQVHRWVTPVLTAAGALVVAMAVLATIGIRMADRERAGQIAQAFPSAIGVASALPQPIHPVSWDPSTRLVRITRDASAVMPGWSGRLVEPDKSPLSAAYVLAAHDDHTFLLAGTLLDDLVVATDPQRTAGLASTTVVGILFPDGARTDGPRTSPATVGSRAGGTAVQAVSWSDPTSGSGTDEITTTVVEIQHGTWLLWVSGMSVDAPAPLRAQAEAAFASLWLR